MASIQSEIDKMFQSYMSDQERKEQLKRWEDAQPQPFTQETLVKFYIEQFNSTHNDSISKEEKDKCAMEIALEIKSLLSMTNGQIKEHFRVMDEKRVEVAMRANARVVFEFCLIREMSSKKDLVGEAREKFRKERIAAYEAGTFDYSDNEKRSEEILIRMEDVHFPDSAKKLKPIYVSTYDELMTRQKIAEENKRSKK